MKFSKMQGLGNDFVVIDAITRNVPMSAALARRLADRRLGVGCDQVLLAEPPRRAGMDVRYRIFNTDGSEAGHCGNGVRCLAVFLHREGLCTANPIRVEVGDRDVVVRLLGDGLVEVDMGAPDLAAAAVPLLTGQLEPLPGSSHYSLPREGKPPVEFTAVSMGNPHAVITVTGVDQAPVDTLGPWLEAHPVFPAQANIGFMEIVDAAHVRLRVHERGCGETQACGTGACAAVVAGRLRGQLAASVEVNLRGGRLHIAWAGPGQAVRMTGPAVHVFDGVWPDACESGASGDAPPGSCQQESPQNG
jgi:diaminopimelate epimerase